MTLSGAYGRDYKSVAAIEADLLAGKDFVCRDMAVGGSYTNMPDLQKLGIKSVTVRYKADRSVTVINLDKLEKKAAKAAEKAKAEH